MDQMNKVRGAGGGGDKGPRQPIESPDSLRSIEYARIVDLIGEGEIYGFANQSNPLSCVFLNETPIANADGSLNFRNVQIDSRVGTQTQAYLPNFEGVENEIAVGVELRYGTPWVRSVTNTNLNSIRVRLSTPALTSTDTTNGDVRGHRVGYQIELQTDGGAYVSKLVSAFTGKTTSKYSRSHRIELPVATVGWSLRVTRTSGHAETSAIQDSTHIESVAEIVEAKLRMPMSALVSTIIDAEQFNALPSRAFHIKGRIIRVPSNYDPDNRTYTGVWDGTFQSRFCDNPAWVFYDMALNTRYGLGHMLASELVDKWALYRIAQYCDQLVPDGFGSFEPRFTCNLVLQSQNDALRVMQDLATVFRGIIYANGGAITAVSDMPEDVSYTYTSANVVDGKFVYSGSSRKVRHTVALVSWTDLSDFGRAKVEYIDDPEGITRYGVQPTENIAIGCISRGQARRWGRYALATERYETDSVVFGVGLDGTVIAPGKLVNIADPLRAGVRRGGRIKTATINSVNVDFMSISVISGDTLVVTLPNGTTERRVIDTIAGTVITVVSNFSAIPVPQSVWAADSDTLPLATYRVLGVVERNEGDSIGYGMSAVIHIPGKFAFADAGEPMEPAPIPQLPGSTVPSPIGLAISQRDVTDQNTSNKVVNLSWGNVSVAVGYGVLWRQGHASWMDLGTVGYNNIDIANVNPGPFEVQVVAINSLGLRSPPTFGGPYDITPVATPPGFVAEILADISQEVLDRFNADADVAAAAAADATTKANAARDAAFAHADVIGAQVADILEADLWVSTGTYPVGDLVQYEGKLYRALTENTNQQPDTNADDWQFIGNYSSLGEAVAASVDMGYQNTTDIEAVSTQLDAVVARMPAGSGAVATAASVISETSARVAGDAAAATRLDVVEARMPAGADQLATATAVSAIDARVITAEGNIAINTSALTALEASTNGRGVNLLPDKYSTFELAALPATPGSFGEITRDASVVSPVRSTNGVLRVAVAASATEAYVYLGDSYNIPHTPGKRYIVSTFIATDGEPRNIECLAVMSNGDSIGFGVKVKSVAGAMRNSRLSWIVDLSTRNEPAFKIRLDINGTSGQYMLIDGIQVEELLGTATTPSAYSRGSTGAQTNANSSAISLLDARVTTTEGNITSQSSQITTLNARIVGNPGGNRLENPGFANSTMTGWQSSSGATVAYSARLGGYHIAGTPGSGVERWIASSISANSFNTATPGDVYAFSASVNCDSSTWRLSIQFRDAGGAVTGSTDSASQSSTAGDWARLSMTSAAAPAGTTTVNVVLFAANTTSHHRLFHPKLELGTYATPYSEETTINANANATSLLDVRVTTTEAGIASQSSQIVSLTSSIAGKADVSALTALTTRVATAEGEGFGVNLLPNALLLPNATLWGVANGSGGAFGDPVINLAGASWVPPGMRNWGVTATGTPSTSQYVNMYSARTPVVQGQWYFGSVYMATHRGQAQLYIEWTDAVGAVITYTGGPTVVNIVGGQVLTDWARRQALGQAPSGARFGRVIVQARGDGVNANPYVWMLRPMLELTTADQANASSWNAGGFEAQAAYTLRLDVNGYVTGWNFTNDGTTGEFNIVADYFRIVSPAGGARTEYSSGNWRVYDAGGTLRVRMGVW